MAENEIGGGRGCLFVVAAGLGVFAAYAFAVRDMWGVGVLVFFGVGLGYTLLAALAVQFCQGLRSLAFPSATAWDGDTAAGWAVLWPLSLVFWLIITPFFAMINRLFK